MKTLKNEVEVNQLFDRLYPICRSITGDGIRKSLKILQEYIPLDILSFNTGEKVLNWTIPPEWVIRDAWIKDDKGNIVIDFKNHNLHVLNYSDAIDGEFSLEELKKNIHVCEYLPSAIPYVTSYYKKRWGFCMSKNQLNSLDDGKYHAYIDSEFIDGELNVGELVLKGSSDKEILISSYLCHPSMANNELSGPIVLAMLYQKILKWKDIRFTYRFVLNPETIGSIAYLSIRGRKLKEKMYSGLVLTCLGGEKNLRYKKARNEETAINKFVSYLKSRNIMEVDEVPFTPLNGSDERQYCSPGFNLPVGQLSKLSYGQYKEYHTSLDNKEVMGIENIIKSAEEIEKILRNFEIEGYYINKNPYGEVKLDDYDLYPSLNSRSNRASTNDSVIDTRKLLNSILMILNYSDGEHLLSEIANKLNMDISEINEAVEILIEKELLSGPFSKEEIENKDNFNNWLI